MKRSWLTSVMAVVLCACSGSDATVDADPADSAGLVDSVPAGTFSASIGTISVDPGQEQTVCVVVELGNTDTAVIQSIHTQLTAGTHHVIVHRTSAALSPTPTPCGAFAGGGDKNGLLFIAQQLQARIDYPAGTGLTLDPNQHIHLEMHYFNASDSTLNIGATAFFDLAPGDGAGLTPIQLRFTGNLSLSIPPMGTQTVHSFHPLPVGAQVFGLTSHTHQYGTRGAISIATGIDDPNAVLMHESLNWDEPPLDSFAPVALGANEGLWLTCEFFNTSNQTVNFGTGANDEMCFLWAYYFVP